MAIDPARARLAREVSEDFGRYMGGATVDLVTGETVPVQESLRRSVDHQILHAAYRAARLCAALCCGWCAKGHAASEPDALARRWHEVPADDTPSGIKGAVLGTGTVKPYCTATRIRDLFGLGGDPCPLPAEVRVAQELMGREETTL